MWIKKWQSLWRRLHVQPNSAFNLRQGRIFGFCEKSLMRFDICPGCCTFRSTKPCRWRCAPLSGTCSGVVHPLSLKPEQMEDYFSFQWFFYEQGIELILDKLTTSELICKSLMPEDAISLYRDTSYLHKFVFGPYLANVSVVGNPWPPISSFGKKYCLRRLLLLLILLHLIINEEVIIR